jgi:hypothetical protein
LEYSSNIIIEYNIRFSSLIIDIILKQVNLEFNRSKI